MLCFTQPFRGADIHSAISRLYLGYISQDLSLYFIRHEVLCDDDVDVLAYSRQMAPKVYNMEYWMEY